MEDYLLDTNILSYWYNIACPEHAQVVCRANAARQARSQTNYVARFFVSVVTLGEIQYGHRVASKPDIRRQAEYERFTREQCPVSLEITRDAAEHYGELRAWLFENCGPNSKRAKRAEELVHPTTGVQLGIDENDLWIAAQAKAHNLVLVTHDSRGNFGKVLRKFNSALRVQDWTS